MTWSRAFLFVAACAVGGVLVGWLAAELYMRATA